MGGFLKLGTKLLANKPVKEMHVSCPVRKTIQTPTFSGFLEVIQKK